MRSKGSSTKGQQPQQRQTQKDVAMSLLAVRRSKRASCTPMTSPRANTRKATHGQHQQRTINTVHSATEIGAATSLLALNNEACTQAILARLLASATQEINAERAQQQQQQKRKSEKRELGPPKRQRTIDVIDLTAMVSEDDDDDDDCQVIEQRHQRPKPVMVAPRVAPTVGISTNKNTFTQTPHYPPPSGLGANFQSATIQCQLNLKKKKKKKRKKKQQQTLVMQQLAYLSPTTSSHNFSLALVPGLTAGVEGGEGGEGGEGKNNVVHMAHVVQLIRTHTGGFRLVTPLVQQRYQAPSLAPRPQNA